MVSQGCVPVALVSLNGGRSADRLNMMEKPWLFPVHEKGTVGLTEEKTTEVFR